MRMALFVVCQQPPSWILAAMLTDLDGSLTFMNKHALNYLSANVLKSFSPSVPSKK